MASTSNTNTEFVMIEAELLDCSVCFERPNDGPILQVKVQNISLNESLIQILLFC